MLPVWPRGARAAPTGAAAGEPVPVEKSAGDRLIGTTLNGTGAFAYNAAGIPIAAGALYPLTGTLPSPMLAAAAMSLSSVSVIANALRLRA